MNWPVEFWGRVKILQGSNKGFSVLTFQDIVRFFEVHKLHIKS